MHSRESSNGFFGFSAFSSDDYEISTEYKQIDEMKIYQVFRSNDIHYERKAS